RDRRGTSLHRGRRQPARGQRRAGGLRRGNVGQGASDQEELRVRGRERGQSEVRTPEPRRKDPARFLFAAVPPGASWEVMREALGLRTTLFPAAGKLRGSLEAARALRRTHISRGHRLALELG